MTTISVVVVPRSSRCGVVKMDDGTLKVKLTAPPVDGEANEQLIRVLGDYFDAPKSAVTIVKGQRGKRKFVEIK